MSTTITDVDELEALLADLDGPVELQPEPEVVEQAPAAAEVAPEPDLPKPVTRARRTRAAAKPAETPTANSSDDDLDAALEGLDELDSAAPTKIDNLSRSAKDEILEALDRAEPASHPEVDADLLLDELERLGQPGLGVPMDELTPEQQQRVLDAQANTLAEQRVDDGKAPVEVDLDALIAGLDDGGQVKDALEAATVPVPKESAITSQGTSITAKSATAADLNEALDARAALLTPRAPQFIFKPSGSLETFVDGAQLQQDLHFTETSISNAMTRQAALFAHYSTLAAHAKYQADRCKQHVELLYANLDQQYRDDLTAAGTKFTEKVIEAMIQKDSGYQAAQARAHEAKAIASMVDTAADSFRHRKDMLIQVGADLRQQREGELRLSEKRHPGEAALEAMKK